MNIYHHILEYKKKDKKLFAILIDPDKETQESLLKIIEKAELAKVDFFFLGGSLLTYDNLNHCLITLKKKSNIQQFH